MMAARVWNFWK